MKALYIDRRPPVPARQPPAVRVRSVMSTPVSCVTVNVTLAEALRLMLSRGVRHLVVLDTAGCCAGVLSDRAVAAAWAADPTALDRATVRDLLDPVPATVGLEESVSQVARFMRAAGTDAVAVLDGTCSVAGIVTGSDLIGVLAG